MIMMWLCGAPAHFVTEIDAILTLRCPLSCELFISHLYKPQLTSSLSSYISSWEFWHMLIKCPLHRSVVVPPPKLYRTEESHVFVSKCLYKKHRVGPHHNNMRAEVTCNSTWSRNSLLYQTWRLIIVSQKLASGPFQSHSNPFHTSSSLWSF